MNLERGPRRIAEWILITVSPRTLPTSVDRWILADQVTVTTAGIANGTASSHASFVSVVITRATPNTA